MNVRKKQGQPNRLTEIGTTLMVGRAFASGEGASLQRVVWGHAPQNSDNFKIRSLKHSQADSYGRV